MGSKWSRLWQVVPITALFVLRILINGVTGFTPSRHRVGQSFAGLDSSLKQEVSSKYSTDISYGDARGAAALLVGISVSRGPNQILTGIDWRVEPTSKWALVGANGAGKSTLLKALMGELFVDAGTITIGTTQQVGYLQQTAVSGSTKTVYDEAASAMTEIEEARIKLEQIAAEVAEMSDPNEASLQRLEAATESFEAVGGYTQEKEVTSVLKGLGFHDMNKRCDELSGGWQMRVALARLLLSKPSLLLLDEPSNHLDINARTWLANYLKNYEDGAMVLVTHDVGLLSCAQHIAEVQGGTLQTYKSCTYDQYLAEKEFRAQAAETEYERNKEKAAKLQGFIDKFGASATKASAAQSRVKQIEKMENAGLLDTPPEALIRHRFKPKLKLPDPPRAIGETLVALEGAAIGHEDKVLVSDVDLEVKRGMKLFLRGPNGVGKSTLLHSLRGTLELLDGKRKANSQLALGVFTQDLAQELDAETPAVDLVTAYAREIDPTISDKDARSVMGTLGLKGEKALREIQHLSGGEKARVALSMFAVRPSNLILLDEPSNHLDVECIEALGESLSGWGEDDGAVVVISHDKEFCNHMEFTHVGTVENGKLRVQQRGTTDADWNLFEGSSSTIAPAGRQAQKYAASSDEAAIAAKEQKKLDRTLRKKIYNAPKRIAKIETLIEAHEKEVSEIDAAMVEHGSDVEKLMELTELRTVVENKIAELMTEWEGLEEMLAAA